ncbi:hypothetical protein [Phytoactinopolyspora endophytica]|uniref:hypothetical protein n=1 Tax=Phytoactinopolyspora endophytica TaxID=1642495 RepID=UPI00101C469F|nr:hypothetical protein [Phytoactinopolyspora endophytica]
MTNDDQMRRLFRDVKFPDEPAMTSMATDDLRRGQRHLRRRRVASWTTGVAGVAALATGAALAFPGDDTPGSGTDLDVAGESDQSSVQGDNVEPDTETTTGTETRTETEAEDEAEAREVEEQRSQFDDTTQLLLDTAAEHIDPERTYLPQETTNTGSGSGEHGVRVSSKLGWTVPGESGMGMVQVAVTTPGYVDGEYAREDVAMLIGCETLDACEQQTIPETGETVLVAEEDPDRDLAFGVMYERADGSLTAIGVYDLFGNNSTEPVSEMDISLEQAFAFVTDPDLQIDPEVAEQAAAEIEEERSRAEQEQQDLDLSSTEQIPAPDAENMTEAEMSPALAECVEGVPDWDVYTPLLGVHADVETEQPYTPVSWIVAENGDSKLLCELDSSGRFASAGIFGSAEAKDTPYLTGPVERKSSGFGLYTSDVDRVTVQTSGGPEQDAIMRDGYWFLPLEENNTGMALRAYDTDGEPIYDSSEVDPDTCYTDPEGEEVLRLGVSDDPDPEDCLRMLEWDH